MRKIFTTALLAGASFCAFGQGYELSNLGCATVTTQQEIQEVYDFAAMPPSMQKTTAGNDTIPLTIHIVGKNDGTGYYELDKLFTAVCELNQKYVPVGFYFYIQWPIRFVNNSSYYEHNYNSGYQMMVQNNVANSINLYFVKDPSGACGYFSHGGKAVAIRNDCANPGNTTITHEIGHYMGLPHTFYGWENNNTPSYPEKVTRGSGSNCSTAGDGFCDTDADYLSYRWPCPYTGYKLDPDGIPYYPDSSMYMCYATDACMSRFSNQQMSRMQNKLYNDYNNILNLPRASYAPLATANMVYPGTADLVHSNYKYIIWNKVPEAEYYYVKIKSLNAIPQVKTEMLTTDTAIQLSGITLTDGRMYNLEVTPLHSMNVCISPTKKTFTYTNATTPLSVSDEVLNSQAGISITPNPATGGNIKVLLNALPQGNYTMQVVNINGQKVYNSIFNHTGGDNTAALSLPDAPAGMYILRVFSEQNQWTEKLIIQ